MVFESLACIYVAWLSGQERLRVALEGLRKLRVVHQANTFSIRPRNREAVSGTASHSR